MVVARLALAVSRHIEDQGITGPIVVGFDARHKSDVAALSAARVLLARGHHVFLTDGCVPTPFVAFLAKRLRAAAALMITASHNPAPDNGVKVFGPDARQIVAPDDRAIEQYFHDSLRNLTVVTEPATEVPLVEAALWEEYIASCASLAVSDRATRRPLSVVHTALHGVGTRALQSAFARAGFTVVSVPEQALPDARFPTTPFPNPEEPGALEMALDLAQKLDADILVANDPDADRLAVAIPVDGGFRVLTGDELGVLLLWFLLSEGRTRGAVASTIVSSELPAKVCRDFGVKHQTTLTGFKWLSRVEDLGYAYEESIGYCVNPSAVLDKDGISAAILLVDALSSGLNPREVLETLAARYGAHAQENFAARVEEEVMEGFMMRLRALDCLGGIGDLRLYSIEDLARSSTPTAGVRRRYRSAEEGTSLRLIVRPSGTESKLKIYIEATAPTLPLAEAIARQARSACEKELAR
jgi:phosphomannomutase